MHRPEHDNEKSWPFWAAYIGQLLLDAFVVAFLVLMLVLLIF